jgi:hypothetical protein
MHDPSKEERDVPLGVGGGGCGRLPMLGCDSAHAAIAVPLGYRHVRCGAASTDPNLAAAAASIAAAPNGGRAAIFISAKIAPAEIADPAAVNPESSIIHPALKPQCVPLEPLTRTFNPKLSSSNSTP